MFGPIGWMELTIIIVIALLVVGPRGLPKLGRSLGRTIREFKKEARELKEAVDFEINEEERREAEAKRRKRRPPKAKKEESESKPKSG